MLKTGERQASEGRIKSRKEKGGDDPIETTVNGGH